jgi:hypothetical protein
LDLGCRFEYYDKLWLTRRGGRSTLCSHSALKLDVDKMGKLQRTKDIIPSL